MDTRSNMNEESNEMKGYEGKDVKLILSNGYRYTISVQKVTDNFLLGLDKFSNRFMCNLDDIKSIIQVSGGQNVV